MKRERSEWPASKANVTKSEMIKTLNTLSASSQFPLLTDNSLLFKKIK
jgi:hypothetical protein